MTFDQACHIQDPNDLAWGERMARYVRYIGRSELKQHLPAKPPELAREWLRDQHFNAMPLRRWEEAVGYAGFRDSQSTLPIQPSRPKNAFIRMLHAKNITDFNMSEAIALLKYCAELEARDFLKEALADRPDPDVNFIEIWAVFEHCSARPDKLNQFNIFDFDCIETFRSEQDAIQYEMANGGRRVRKLIRIRDVNGDLARQLDRDKTRKEDGANGK